MQRIFALSIMLLVALSSSIQAQTNLALGKTSFASTGNQPAANAFDGDAGTRWESASEDPQWIYVDLEESYNLTSVVLSWEGAYGATYEIQVSDDATNWTAAYTETAGDGGEDVITLSASGRYVRMYGTSRGTIYGYSLWEFGVYGNAMDVPAYLSDLQVNGVTVDGFAANKSTYEYPVLDTETVVPTVTATAAEANATVQVTPATTLPGTTTILVTADGGEITKTYEVNFLVVGTGTAPTIAAPVPTNKAIDVQSIYSDSFEDLPGTNFYAWWNQATVVTEENIDGNRFLKYANLNYQGTELGSSMDVSDMEYMHVDVWSSDASAISFGIISVGPIEGTYVMTPTNKTWVGYDIPLSAFTNNVDLSGIFQLIVTDNGTGESPTIYLDNLYFYKTQTPTEADAYVTDLRVNGTTVADFKVTKFNYDVELPKGTTDVPDVAATLSNAGASISIVDAVSLPGTTTVSVTSVDGTVTNVYELNFTVAEFTNLSLNKPAFASSEVQPAGNAVDADMKTRWETVFADPQWIYVDIGNQASISKVNLLWEGAFASAYEIQVSNDASNWSTIYTETNGDGGEDNLTVSGIGRYVRMYGTARGTEWGYSLWNFEVLGAAVTAESDATLSDLQVNGETINAFNAGKLNYVVVLPMDETVVPSVTATATQANASVDVLEATSLPGTTTITVTAEDGNTELVYKVDFLFAGGDEPIVAAPLPTESAVDVISIYSDSYSNVPNTNFYTNWNQTTVASEEEIDGNRMLKYTNFNYQGIEFGSSVDVTDMDFVHIDVWTKDATTLNFELISPGPNAVSQNLPVTHSTWISYDIPLSAYAAGVDLADVFQSVFSDGDVGDTPTLYVDNIYFYRNATPAESDAFLADLQIDGNTVQTFNANKFAYEFEVPSGLTEVPQITATANSGTAEVTIVQASEVPGTATVTVVSEDKTNTNIYTVDLVAISIPQVAAPTPPSRAAGDVVSIFSTKFEDVANTNFNPNWAQSTVVSEVEIGGEAVLKYANFNYQGTELSGSVDVSGMEYLHVDIWSPNASIVNLSIISPGPAETPVPLQITQGTWRSYDIPLSSYSGVVDLSNVFQFKFDDGGLGDKPTLYINNLYFYRGTQGLSNDASLKGITINDMPLAAFDPSTAEYTVELASNTVDVPTIAAQASDANANVVVTQATEVPGSASVLVVAEDGETNQTYTVNFVLLSPEADATLSSISIGGEEFTDFYANNFNYEVDLDVNEANAPSVTATATNASATVEVTDASEIPGHAIVKVVSQDQSRTEFYTIFFKNENLIWWDEFSGSKVNDEFWAYDIGDGCNEGENNCGWGNQELQIYREESVQIGAIPGEEGNTAMIIKADSPQAGSFTSGRVKTQEKVDIKYGLLEIRVRVPQIETGLWPALWMLGSNSDEVGWPRSGEMDIMEMGQKNAFRVEQGFPNTTEDRYVGANLIWYSEAACVPGNPTCAAAIAGDANYNNPFVSTTDMNGRFQIYRLYWTSEQIRYTVEDEGVEHDLYAGPFGTTTPELRNIFNKEFFMIMNLAVGGNFTDALAANQVTTPFPANMYIDYVRLSKLNGQGSVTIHDPSGVANEPVEETEVPSSMKLHQNYPNPFNPSTQIAYEIMETANVEVRVSDMLGRTISVLENGRKNAGAYTLSFDASGLSSGVYFYTLIVNNQLIDTKKMLLIK